MSTISFRVQGDYQFEAQKIEGRWRVRIYTYTPTGEVEAAEATDKDQSRAMGKAVYKLKAYLAQTPPRSR